MSKIAAFIQARLRAALIAAVLVLGVYSLVSYSHARQRTLEASLAGGTPAARDTMVEGLVENGRLPDILINTQNPDEDVTSPHNRRSLLIRKNATDSTNRLSAEQKITPAETFDTLFPICKDADATVKASAESGLTALGKQNDANLNAVVQRLSNGDPDIRNAAVDVLGLIGGVKTAAIVNGVLLNTAAQDSAIAALAKVGAPAVPFVVAHLEDPAAQNDIQFRQLMVGLLDSISAAPSVPELIKIIGMPGQPSVQRLAQVALADSVLVPYLLVQTDQTALAAAKDSTAKSASQAALTQAEAALPGLQRAEAVLRRVLSDPKAASDARAQAALALGRFATPTAIAALVTALGDYDAQVRDASATGIQASGSSAVGPLTAALAQGPVLVRVGAAEALGGIGTPAAVSGLTQAFQSPATSDTVREAAVMGLGRSGDPQVIPLLVRALGEQDGAAAGAAQDGLLSPALAKTAIPALVASLSQPAPVPFNASETLARMGALAESDAVPLLTRSIATGNSSSQTWAAVTLGEIGTKSAPALTALRTLSKSPDPHVQYAASQSLLKLAGA